MKDMPFFDLQTYTLLRACARKLAAGNPQLQQEIPEILCRVYFLYYQKRKALETHPNPRGWLVETTRRLVLEEMRRLQARQARHSRSLDDEGDIQRIEGAQARDFHAALQRQQCTDDQMERIEDVIGAESLKLLLDYYAPDADREALARRNGLSPDALRQRVRRCVQKIRERLR